MNMKISHLYSGILRREVWYVVSNVFEETAVMLGQFRVVHGLNKIYTKSIRYQ
jgi:hypothetical protein